MKALIIIDVQVDFVTGPLGTPEAQEMIPNLVKKLQSEQTQADFIFTQDTHGTNYADTAEGRLVPPHCLKGTAGWELVPQIQRFTDFGQVIEKKTYGTTRLPTMTKKYDTIEICGLCTDICVSANFQILKAAYPEIPIVVIEDACAGVTPELHEAAIKVMQSCQARIAKLDELI